MRRGALAIAAAACCLVFGCDSSCQQLAEEACSEHGEDSVICISRQNEQEEGTAGKENLCKRALVLYRSQATTE
jgi:hypothetical protein